MQIKKSLLSLCGLLFVGGLIAATQSWPVHSMERPNPTPITPGNEVGAAPSDAIVLFDGSDLSKWASTKANEDAATWKVENGYFEAVPKAGSITTRDSFGSCQLHIEWRTPTAAEMTGKTGQNRGNSGVFLMSTYEIQVLDSYTEDNYKDNKTYADGQAASVYGQNPPLVNACRKPGQWQTYDIVFHRPIFDGNGAVTRPATVTVFQNGVLVQDHFEITGATAHKQEATYHSHPDKLPIQLQDHGQPTRFRNIWIRPLAD